MSPGASRRRRNSSGGTDWSRLAFLAPIVESYLRRPEAAALSEIRMKKERFGATVVDRMRARISIAAPGLDDNTPAAAAAVVESIVTAVAARRDSTRRRLAADP